MSDADPTTRELAIEIEHGKEVVNLRVDALTARLDASDKAIRVYETSMQERKASHNEWRKSLEDSRKDTLSRSEVNARWPVWTRKRNPSMKTGAGPPATTPVGEF